MSAHKSVSGLDAVAALPAEAFVAALAGLPAMGHRRLVAVLRQWCPDEAWRRVVNGRGDDDSAVAELWARAAEDVDVDDLWRVHLRAGVGVLAFGRPDYPAVLADDHQPPGVLFHRGDPGAFEGRRVGIVGTRRCTRYGREMARELGRDLAASGVRVVSGLAVGVDGAAHAGALAAAAAPPIAVVGSGVDVVYPRANRELWAGVAAAGLLLSEAPIGAAPEPWRFPVRNRVIAALSEVVVVVESHIRGGSRYTVEAAAERSRTVMAVPGSVRNPASAYTNALLADGCAPARDATDVLVALGLSTAGSGSRLAEAIDHRPPPGPVEASVLDALGWEPASLEGVVLRSGLSPSAVTVALAHLERDGWVVSTHGWWERVADG
ncbi:MAG TPA: DNA-processing protein DprA [Acidimicrobiales bacterium]|nr:DNA-processing protein DprA [Acidimicrobiales bacterium]